MISSKLLRSSPILTRGLISGKKPIISSPISFSSFISKNNTTRGTILQRRFTSNLKEGGKTSNDKVKDVTANTSFLQRWMSAREMPPRNTFKWYGEMVLICTVFAITGTSTMVLVRPAVSEVLGLKGTMKDGPWSYRICSLVIMTPLYSCMLVVVGTVFGRHAYFRHFAVKMFSRFGIPPELMDKSFKETAKNFRKY
jgi:hypothetical protein